MPDLEEITARILDIVEIDLKWPVDRAEVTADTPLGGDGLALDSVMIISTAVQLEDAFGISMSDDEVIQLADSTVGETAKYVMQMMERP